MEKIIIIHHNKKTGGSGKSLIEVVQNLSGDFDISVICPQASPMENLLRENNIKVISYNIPVGTIEYYNGGPKVISRTYFTRLLARKNFTAFVGDVLSKEKPNYVFLNSIVLSYLIPVVNKYSLCISFVRETFPNGGSRIILSKFRKLLSKASTVFYLSDFDRDFFGTKNGITLRNTVSDDFFDEISRETARKNLNLSDSNQFSLLFVGGASSLKGAKLLSDAAKLLPSDMEIVISGNDLDKTKEIFKEASCKITFLGFCKDMKSALYATDALVFPSTMPHQARPVFEAGATKKPVIISDFPETKEQVINDINGLTFIPQNVNDLVSKILLLKDNPSLRKRLGEENYLVTSKNNKRTVAKETLNSVLIH